MTISRLALSFDRINRLAGSVSVTPAVDVPGTINAQPLIGTIVELTEPEVTGVTSIVYQWYRGAPTTTAISGATSADYTPVDADFNLTLYRRATYTNATGDTIEDLEAPAVVGRVYSEDWAGYTVGNTLTEIEVLYDRNSGSGFSASITSDTEGPAGKAAMMNVSVSNQRGMWRADAQSFGNTNSANVTKTQALFFFQHLDVAASGRYPLRFVGTDAFTWNPGVFVYNNNCRLQIDSDGINVNVGTSLGTLVSGTYYWLRLEQEGTTIRGSLWESGDPEPSSWQAERTNAASFTSTAPLMGVRHSSSNPEDLVEILYWSCGYNAQATYWPGFSPPPPSTSDPMTFAAASSVTSATFADSAMVINLEDV